MIFRCLNMNEAADISLFDDDAEIAEYAKAAVYAMKEKDIISGTDNNLFEPQPLHFQVKRDTPATKPQKERLYRLAEQHKITLEVDVEKLTRSEASRLADKILAKYGR